MTPKNRSAGTSKPESGSMPEQSSKSNNTLHKIQVPSSPDFLEELDEANDKINEITKHNYRLKRSNVGRVLFKMYLSVADQMGDLSIHDDESLKDALIEAIKKMPRK